MKKMIVLGLAMLLMAGCAGQEQGHASPAETEKEPVETIRQDTETTAIEPELPAAETVPDAGEETARYMLTAHSTQQGENTYSVTCGDTFVLLRFNPETMLFAPYDNRDLPLTEKEWTMVTPTSDGRILLWDAMDPTHYFVWLEGELYQSGEYDQILWFDGDWILAAYEGVLGMYNPDGDLMKNLCPWKGGMAFREALSGWCDRDITGGNGGAGMYVFLFGSEQEYYVIKDTGIPERENAVPGMTLLPPPPQETAWYLYRNQNGYITTETEPLEDPAYTGREFIGTYTTRTAEPQFDSEGGKLLIGEWGQWTLYDPGTETAAAVPVPDGASQVYVKFHPETGEMLGSIVSLDGTGYAWCSPEGVPLTEYRFRNINQFGGGTYMIGTEDRPETEDEYDSRNWAIDAVTGECREIGWEGVSVLEAGDVTFFLCNDWYETSYDMVVLKEDLTPLQEGRFWQVRLLGDGRLLGIPMAEENASAGYFEIFDSDGTLQFTSRTYENVFCLAGEYIAVADGGRLCLADTDGSIVVDFAPWTEDMLMHFMLSGYVEDGKDLQPEGVEDPYRYRYYERNDAGEYVPAETDRYPAGVYLLTEDNAVGNGVAGRAREYFWNPETGLVGMLTFGEVGGYAKPVLYLYPEETTDVTVTFARPELLTTVYPIYGDGWQVTAEPDGTLTDAGGREYYALYWEESGHIPVDFTTGFCVSGEDATAFLEEKLDALGLTHREANEMILYWLPILEKNAYSLVYFELTGSREAYNRLQIEPVPDSLLRIAVHIKAVKEPVQVKEQILPRWERTGFAAVEWGGVIHE
ncbi:MAG: hypothetical protein IKV57_03475 [Clostridia bacterium]|nr:hypothetical protein [Clostridia bacterium]